MTGKTAARRFVMYKICRTEQSSKRQRAIENTLLSLMHEKKYEDISIIELCAACDVPRKAFYRYFDNKDGALEALIDHTLTDYEEYIAKHKIKRSTRRLSDELEYFFIFWSKQKRFLEAIDKNNLIYILVSSSMKYPVNDVISTRRFLPDDSEWMRGQIFNFTICGLIFLMLDWFRRGFSESAHEMAKTACRILSQPIFPDLESIGILAE